MNTKAIEEARKRRDTVIENYKDAAGETMNCLDEGFEAAMGFEPIASYVWNIISQSPAKGSA